MILSLLLSLKIGLKSSHDSGGFSLGIARMWAFFHDLGKVPDAKHWFIRTESGRARNKANSRISFAAMLHCKNKNCLRFNKKKIVMFSKLEFSQLTLNIRHHIGILRSLLNIQFVENQKCWILISELIFQPVER